jgi:hypothetical protein
MQFYSKCSKLYLPFRDVFGDCALVGDSRWAGTYGVSGDFIARDNCRQIEMTTEVYSSRVASMVMACTLVLG